MRALGASALVLFAAALMIRVFIVVAPPSGGRDGSGADLPGLIGAGAAAGFCGLVISIPSWHVARVLKRAASRDRDRGSSAFAVVVDDLLRDSLEGAGFRRLNRSWIAVLLADGVGLHIVSGRDDAASIDLPWGRVTDIRVGSATSRWSTSAWSNVILTVATEHGVNSVPRSVMPGVALGNYTAAQMERVISALEAQRPKAESG